jgi:two-component system, chemotaxis family, sensor kinase CheA
VSDYLDPNNEELLQDFFSEAEMQVDLLESNLLVLEKNPGDPDAVDEIFRAAHTLKGASATVQMNELAEFTHTVEDAFDYIREHGPTINADLIDLLLSAIDIVKGMLAAKAEGASFDGDHRTIAQGLRDWVASESQAGSGVAVAAQPEPPRPSASGTAGAPDASGQLSEQDRTELAEATEGAGVLSVRVGFDESNPMNSVGGIQVFSLLKQYGVLLKSVPDFDELYEDLYHPEVTYYIASDRDPAEIEAGITIAGVTTSVSVTSVDLSTPESDGSIEGVSAQSFNPEQSSIDIPSSSPVAGADDPIEVSDETSHDPGKQQEPKTDSVEAAATARKSTPSSSVLRVDSRRVDDLLNLVSETVINKAAFNQVSSEFSDSLALLQNTNEAFRSDLRDLFDALPDYLGRMQAGASAKEIKREIGERFGDLYSRYDGFTASFRHSVAKFRSTAQNLGRITGDLQEGVMRIRMVPISQIFSRFPRLVRDLTRSLNKDVDLQLIGQETELDKSVIEDLLDPLIHCVRNSIDHGIESAQERAASGKEPTGTLELRAANEGNMIVIEIVDDGKGIDVQAVKQKAIERGVIHSSKVLSDVEAFNLIFDPGFSTAKQVSNISGRGVGLDVVKRQIEKLNGTVAVWSEQGKGTRFTIKIPLTLAIIQGLMVKVGGETYAIPITAVVESHRIKPDDVRVLDNHEVLNVREDVISLMRLSRIFRIDVDPQPAHLFVVIVGSGDKKVGLVVDALIGEEDVVIKPLRDQYTNAPGIAGANITGDGHVSLIIDVAQLLELGLRDERNARRRRGAVIGS